MKPYRKLFKNLLPALAATVLLSAASCNKSSEDEEIEYNPSQSVAVTAFSLSPDIRVMADLDSVHFAIDLDHGVIFNPDSLPKGTFVGRLITKISYPSTVTHATITMEGGSHRADGVVDYKTYPNDTIDFTGKVTLTLSDDNGLSRSYRLKVNVHTQNPDSLIWTENAASALPAASGAPLAQKTVSDGSGKVTTVIREADNSLTLAQCDNIFSPVWSTGVFSFPATPEIESLTLSEGNFYMLDTAGHLYSSPDAANWSALDTSAPWSAILGNYAGTVLGIRNAGGKRVSVAWPENAVAECELPDLFPIQGWSQLIEVYSDWAAHPTAILFGGVKPDGSVSATTWGFDGNTWADLSGNSATSLPALNGPIVWKYTTFVRPSAGSYPTPCETLIAMGGLKADGNINQDTFVSYDNGLTWHKAVVAMQLPETMPALRGSDIVIASAREEAPLDRYWKVARRSGYDHSFENGNVVWQCPYIFRFGGYNAAGTLNTSISCGVLRRLTFAPLF